MRLAELNGYRSLGRVLGLVGHPTMPRTLPNIDYSHLADLFAQPADVLRGMSYPNASRGLRKVMGHQLPAFSVETSRPRICLDCLREDFKIKALWDLTLLVCCPEHGSYLLADCPECRRSLEWGRPSWNRCHCGFDFSEAKPKKAPGSLLAFSRCLQSKLSGETFAPEAKFPPDLGLLSPGSLMVLTALLGYWFVKESHAPLGSMFRGMTMVERSEVVQAGFEILMNWPEGFEKFLDRVKGKDPYRATSILMYRDFGRLYYNLMYVFKASDLDFVRQALKDYDVQRREELVCDGLSPEEVEDIGFHGPAKSVGFSATALKKMARQEGVALRKLRPVGALRKVVLTLESQNDLASRKQDRLRYVDVAQILGLRLPMARKLIEGGLLTKDPTTVLDGRGNESYSRKEVESLLADLQKLARPIAEMGDAKHALRLVKAFHVYGREEFTSNDILAAVRDGQLVAYRDSASANFSDLYLCGRQLSQLVRKTVIGDDLHLVDFESALEVFHLSTADLKTLFRHGAIEYIVRPFGGRNYTLVDRHELEKFLANHVKASRIFEAKGQSGWQLKELLEGKGLVPMWERVPGDSGAWYEVSKVRSAGLTPIPIASMDSMGG